jgi:hypothetical protein
MYLSVLSNDFSLFLQFILLDFETVPTVYRVCFYLILLRLIMKSMTNHFRDDYFSLLRQTSSYFYRCEIFLSCTSARQKKSRAFCRQMHAVQFMSTVPPILHAFPF